MTAPAVLVVEDDPGLRVLIARALQQNGFAVFQARSGPEMWNSLEQRPVDLILLDIMLPGHSGIDLCRELRARSDTPIIATVVDDLQDRGYDITYVGPEHCDARFRPVEFKRALSNLTNNAVQYGNRAIVRLLVDDKEIRIRVEDDGPGIPEADMQRVLEPFQRLDPARQRNTSGVGLGIPIAVRAIAAAGGKLILSNRREGGLCAQIVLPRQDAGSNTL